MENTLLNLIPAAYLPEIHLSQYDVGRTITFTLKDGASDYSVPSGASVKVKATKPSGFGFEVACTFNGGTVTLVTTDTMTPENGRFPAELSIVSGNTTIGTSNFIFNIERSPHPEGTIDGDSESLLPELTLLVERIEAAAEDVDNMVESLHDLSVSANTLEAGQEATASYDSTNNRITFGIPKGEDGTYGEIAGAVKDIVVAYDNLEPYLYKKNTYIRNGVDTALNGYDTYKIPLNDFDILRINWVNEFWTGLGKGYIVNADLSDGTRIAVNTKSNTFGLWGINDTFKECIFYGKVPGLSEITAIYLTAKNSLESEVSVAINYPYTQYVFDENITKTLDPSNTIKSPIVRDTYGVWRNFAEPYFAYWLKMSKGDKITINKTVTGVTGKGIVIKADGTSEIISSYEYEAEGTCIVTIYDNSTVEGNIIYTPASEEETDKQFDGLDGVAFGTSLTYKAQTTGGFLTKLSELSGITFDNQGIGSSYILGNMLTAIKNYSGYAGKRVCTLEGFVNDWYGNKALGTYTDTTESTVCGCVRSAINYIMSQNANITLFLILDHYGRNTGGVDCSTTATNGAGLTQFEYYEEISKVAESLGVPVIKEYAISQISENTPQYLADNIHLNALGANQSAYAIWGKMREYFPNLI